MELLIEAVRARPVLWDCSLEVYRDNILKNTAWEEVASLVNEEKNIVKDKWKKLRDCHRQALQRRKTTTGQAATKNKKWKYEDQMQFLLKTMAHGPSDSNVPPPVDNTQVANEEEEEDSEDVTELQLEGNDESATTNDIPAGTPSQKRQRPPKGADKIISFMREKHEHKMSMKKPRELDDIDLFFASAAQSVRRLPRQLQNKVKINLLNSIAAAEEERMNGTSPIHRICKLFTFRHLFSQ